MNRQPWTLQDIASADFGRVEVWASRSVRERASRLFPFPAGDPTTGLTPGVETLIVVGGGTLIDKAKIAARESPRPVKVIAVPSIWGSGAEVSPIAVLNDGDRKKILVDESLVPDAYVFLPELASTIPAERALTACGDAWAHALEGFFSPLATPELRLELAAIMRSMLELPLGNDSRWFALSAAACAAQARSSVGLVHGIAHVLEGPLCRLQPDMSWGHAKLCSTFLHPVMALNRKVLENWSKYIATIGNETTVLAVLEKLFDRRAFALARPLLREHWRHVLRDPCTRTNCVLVRQDHIEHFFAGV